MELSNSNTVMLWAVAGGAMLGIAHIACRIDRGTAGDAPVMRHAPATLGQYVAGAMGAVCLAFAARLILKDNTYY